LSSRIISSRTLVQHCIIMTLSLTQAELDDLIDAAVADKDRELAECLAQQDHLQHSLQMFHEIARSLVASADEIRAIRLQLDSDRVCSRCAAPSAVAATGNPLEAIEPHLESGSQAPSAQPMPSIAARQCESRPQSSAASQKAASGGVARRTKPVKTAHKASSQSAIVTELLRETADRNKRASNLIIVGLPLTATDDPTKDTKTAQSLLSFLKVGELALQKVNRIGKAPSLHLRIELHAPSQVAQALSQARTLMDSSHWKAVFIRPDRTSVQTREFKLLLAKKQAANKELADDSTFRYVISGDRLRRMDRSPV
jgi:hypothetical protein